MTAQILEEYIHEHRDDSLVRRVREGETTLKGELDMFYDVRSYLIRLRGRLPTRYVEIELGEMQPAKIGTRPEDLLSLVSMLSFGELDTSLLEYDAVRADCGRWKSAKREAVGYGLMTGGLIFQSAGVIGVLHTLVGDDTSLTLYERVLANPNGLLYLGASLATIAAGCWCLYRSAIRPPPIGSRREMREFLKFRRMADVADRLIHEEYPRWQLNRAAEYWNRDHPSELIAVENREGDDA